MSKLQGKTIVITGVGSGIVIDAALRQLPGQVCGGLASTTI